MDSHEKHLKAALGAEAIRSAGVRNGSKDEVLRRARRLRLVLVFAGVALTIASSATILVLGPTWLADLKGRSPTVNADQPAAGTSSASECRRIPSGGSPQWMETSERQAALEAIGAELKEETGAEPGSPDGLPNGLIGIAVDNVSQTVFVVIDPVLFPDAAGLQQRLQDIASTAFPVAVSASCNSAADLLKAKSVLDAGSWHPAATKVPHAWGLDPYTSTWNVTFDSSTPQAKEVAHALAAELGSLVTIDWTRGIESHGA